MKKALIAAIAAVVAGIGTNALADTQVYTYTDTDGSPIYGELRRVSPDGQWACGGDEYDETAAYIINVSDPQNIIVTTDGLLLDIDNNGMAVGTYYERVGYAKYQYAGIYRNGQWKRLPLPEEILGQSHAVAISEDSRIIAGHGLCSSDDPDEPGMYYPILWELDDESGEYVVKKLYNNIWVPGTNGFYVMDMTPDARYVCGTQWLDFGDTIAILLNTETGEIKRWHNIEYKLWEFEGEYYNTMFVDGVMDGLSETAYFGGVLAYATNSYLFGSHSVASDVQEDGSGNVTTYAAVYDIESGEIADYAKNYTYICGVDPQHAFTTRGEYVVDGVAHDINEYFGITGTTVAGVTSVDNAGRVLTGAYIFESPLGEMLESPVLIILDEDNAINSIKNVTADHASNARISVIGRQINVTGANSVRIHDLNGRIVSCAANATVAPGVYVVTADGETHKVIVK